MGGDPRRRAPRRQASRRDVCIWLGTLASWRPGLVKALVKECGDVSEALERDPRELRALVEALAARSRPPRSRPDPRGSAAVAAAEADGPGLRAALSNGPEVCAAAAARAVPGGRVVAWCDPLYPPGLRQTADPPLCLFVRSAPGAGDVEGRLEALARLPLVAVVGTRAPSPYGEEMASLLGRDLTVRGAVVVSGMAMGVDAAAQGAAVDAVAGRRPPATVGVLGCGADVVYPRVCRPLFAAVVRHGVLVSEFAWGVPARPWRFPARNRVMAALCRAVVVVEGSERSGSLLTADYALEAGREVLAVPGEAGRRLSAAPHRLLRQGATLCESAADALDAIAPSLTDPGGPDEPARGAVASAPAPALHWSDKGFGPVSEVLRTLERGPMTVDQLAARSGRGVAEVGAVLSELEVDGVVLAADGGRYRLRRG